MGSRSASELFRRAGHNVARIRKMRRLTQAQLAEILNVEPDYIGRIERGKENLTLRSLARLSEALGVDPSTLVQRAELEKK